MRGVGGGRGGRLYISSTTSIRSHGRSQGVDVAPRIYRVPGSHFQFNLLKARQKVIRYFTGAVDRGENPRPSPCGDGAAVNGTWVWIRRRYMPLRRGDSDVPLSPNAPRERWDPGLWSLRFFAIPRVFFSGSWGFKQFRSRRTGKGS